MRALRLTAASGLLVASIAVGVGTSGASCVGPRISYEVAPVSPGQVVRVTGEYWGTDCYDTNRPPQGVGNLGEPRTDIEVVVLQDGNGPVVARGDADQDYRFVVDVPIPGPLQPGTLTIAARAGQPRPQVTVGAEIPVTNPAAVAEAPAVPASFDASPATTSATSSEHGGRVWLVAGVVVLAVGLVAALWLWTRSRNVRPSSRLT